MFPADRATRPTRLRIALVVLTMLCAVGQVVPAASHANPVPLPPPQLHTVKYTVTAANPIYADIFYIGQEPPDFGQWSKNPYRFTPNVQVDVGPNAPWVYELQLARPDQWAMISASTGLEPGTPNFHCEIEVDGAVVITEDGAKGVLCSTRTW